MSVSIENILDIITEDKPRRIAIAYDDWRALSEQLLDLTTQRRGFYRKPIDHSRINYAQHDQHAYVSGVFVFASVGLERGEIRVDDRAAAIGGKP
jgi:hypothetical protein